MHLIVRHTSRKNSKETTLLSGTAKFKFHGIMAAIFTFAISVQTHFHLHLTHTWVKDRHSSAVMLLCKYQLIAFSLLISILVPEVVSNQHG